MTPCPTTRGPWRCPLDAATPHECEARDGEAASMVDPRAPTQPAPSAGPTLEKRVEVLEAQVRSLQMTAPRGIE